MPCRSSFQLEVLRTTFRILSSISLTTLVCCSRMTSPIPRADSKFDGNVETNKIANLQRKVLASPSQIKQQYRISCSFYNRTTDNVCLWIFLERNVSQKKQTPNGIMCKKIM